MNRATSVPCRTEAGFTLIEALVAVVVLSFGLIAVTNLMVVAASSNAVANQGTAAAAVASQELERLKALRFNDPGLAAGGDDEVGDTGNNHEPDSDLPGYFTDATVDGVGRIHVRWLIEDLVAARGNSQDLPAGVKYIVVRAEGQGALTGARSRAEFTTFRTENPDPAGPPVAP